MEPYTVTFIQNYASLNYVRDKVTLRFGLISTYLFKVQEKFWSRRYLYRMLTDEHHLGSSADLGASVEYAVNEKLHVDLSFMNGEGYSHLQLDNAFKTGFGLTYAPFKFLILRGFYDFVTKDQIPQGTLALFAGIEFQPIKKVRLSLNYQDWVPYPPNLESRSFIFLNLEFKI